MRFEYQPPGGTWSQASSTGSSTRNQTASTFNASHCHAFVQNNLLCAPYETTPINATTSRIPGYAGFLPGTGDVHGQRQAQASMHTTQLRPQLIATRGAYQSMELVDLRPEQRSYNKNYMYAENITNTHPVNFLRFPGKHNFDHRKM